MCLTTLWPKEKLAALQKRSQTEPIRAWKVMQVGDYVYTRNGHGGGLHFLRGDNRHINFKTNYQINVARGKFIHGTVVRNGKYGPKFVYPAGFHAYANKEVAITIGSRDRYSRVIPVLLWDIVAAGTQRGTVYVARKMMLLV